MVISVPCVFCLGLLIWVILPKGFFHVGREPKDLAQNNLLDKSNEYSYNEQYLSLIMGEIENLQRKITENEKINQTSLNIIKAVIVTISLVTAFALLILFWYSLSQISW